jgi:hypothetical protein
MKKIIAISLVAVSFAATSAFGQGYFQFTSGKSQAYDGFTTPGVSVLGPTVNVAFLWAAAATTPAVDAFATRSLPTGNNTTTTAYTAAQAWTAILTGPFTLAHNSADSSLVTALTSATGVVSYNGGGGFGVLGTTDSIAYTIYEISWSSAYATPALAAAANGGLGSAVGWSAPVQYTPVTQTNPGIIPFTGLFPSFGTFLPIVPEPTTLALAALGGASLLLFRRKK